MKVDLQAAERYLTTLDEEAEFFTWQTFDDAAKGRKGLTKILHGTLENLSEKLIDLNDRGAGIYIAVNATDGRGRCAENIKRVRSVFADLDGAPLEGVQQCALEPQMIIESSPGKFHVYWLVDDLPLDQFRPIQQVIAARFESDPSVIDLPRILRVPGFIHKKNDPFQVKILNESSAIPYPADAILSEFPPTDANQNNHQAAPETQAHGFQAHIAMIGHHKDGGGFHWPITRAIAAYVSQYGKTAPVEPLKAMIRSTVDRADRSRYSNAQINNIKSSIYLDRAIYGAIKQYGEEKEVSTVDDVMQKVESAGGDNVVHLAERRQDKEHEHPQDWMDGITRSEKGGIHSSTANIARILQYDPAWQGVLGWDEFSLKIVKLKPPPFQVSGVGEWTDRDDSKTAIWVSDVYKFRPATSMVAESVGVASELNSYHPVQQYLNSLDWDGTPRVKTWLVRYLGANDDPYARLVGGCWLIGAVARMLRPGCKMDNVLILEGGQGKGKSTALSILGGEWFTDTPFELGSKDGFLAMRGKWIIELSELDTFNRAESTKAKHFFAASVDTYREPYGRRTFDVARQCLFAGTTNGDEYLKDDSGNRRYWPIRTWGINHDALTGCRDQLWAEAVHLFKTGELWWFEHGIDYVGDEQDKRFVTDAWEELVTRYVDEKARQQTPRSQQPFCISVAEVLTDCLSIPVGKWTRADQMRVSSVLKRLGMIRKQFVVDEQRIWAYGPKFIKDQ